MNLYDGINSIYGVVQVEVQGFFVERFINLCKINNINVWDIINVTSGIIRFKINIKEFKKLKSISKKTKCKVKIINKSGLYFNAFKYRKRKLIIAFVLLFLFASIFSTTFIWNITVSGNVSISDEEVISALENSGVHIGKSKFKINTRDVIKNMRVLLDDAAWIGLDIKGKTLNVEIVEKTKADMMVNYTNGDLLSTKEGIIQKLVVENGTALSQEGDYIEKDRIVIEGKIYTRTNEVLDVEAKGKIYILSKYNYTKEYKYVKEEKEYYGKEKYSVGVDINNNENYINYLDKSTKYDIIKNAKDINIFGNKISFCLYKFLPYKVNEIILSKDEIISNAENEASYYMEHEILPTCNEAKVDNIEVNVLDENDETMTVDIVYNVIEEASTFKGRE